MSEQVKGKGSNKANWDDFVKSIQSDDVKKEPKAKGDTQKEVTKDA